MIATLQTTEATRALHRMASRGTVRSSQDSVTAEPIADDHRRSSPKYAQPLARRSPPTMAGAESRLAKVHKRTGAEPLELKGLLAFEVSGLSDEVAR